MAPSGENEGGQPHSIEMKARINTKAFDLTPSLYLMAACACYNLNGSKKIRLVALNVLYKAITVLLLLAYLIRDLAYAWDMLAKNMSTYIVLCQCFGCYIICWKMFSLRYGHFHKSWDMWLTCLSNMQDQGVLVDHRYLRRMQAVIVSVAIALMIACFGLQITAFFITLPPADELRELGMNFSITAPLEDTTFSRLLICLPTAVQICIIIIPPLFLMVIALMLRSGFRALNKQMEGVFKPGNGEEPLSKFERFRQLHFELCNVVSKFDEDISFLFGNVYTWTLSMGIVALYSLVKWQQDLTGLVVSLFYLCLSLGMLLATSVSAAYVHGEAHAPLDTIYYVNVETISLEKATQLNLFLSKLTGTQVGFTTFGLLTITKEFILTIAGVFLTYFAVLYTTV